MKLGIVTDEISLNPEEALNYCKEWGIGKVEIRCLQSGRVPYISEEELNKFIELKHKYEIKVSALSPGFFKGTISEKEKYKEELDKHLPKLIEISKVLDTNMIIVFGFKKEDGDENQKSAVIDVFREIAERAKKNGLKIAVENEPGFWCDTGTRTAEIVKEVGMINFGINWDPANAYIENAEAAFPTGYESAKPYIFNVHVKDTKLGSLVECCPVGEGIIDWEGQIKALLQDKIVEHVTIETHCLPLIEKSKIDIDRIRKIINKYS
jgi:sugar phosphate isomerase/epimerase